MSDGELSVPAGAVASARAELGTELARFHTWAAAIPPAERQGDWEAGYRELYELRAAALALLAALDREPGERDAPPDLLASVLDVLAVDHEAEALVRMIVRLHPRFVPRLAAAALSRPEPELRWQLATALGLTPAARASDLAGAETQLLAFVEDEDEYVRRRALEGLARLGSAAVERLAEREWERLGEARPWTRMMVLWSLHRVGSARLAAYLDAAERDENAHLSGYARKVRGGQVED